MSIIGFTYGSLPYQSPNLPKAVHHIHSQTYLKVYNINRQIYLRPPFPCFPSSLSPLNMIFLLSLTFNLSLHAVSRRLKWSSPPTCFSFLFFSFLFAYLCLFPRCVSVFIRFHLTGFLSSSTFSLSGDYSYLLSFCSSILICSCVGGLDFPLFIGNTIAQLENR